MSQWIKGILPSKSGSYLTRYNGKVSRDEFTVVGKHWWNVGDLKHPEKVEWDPTSYKEL